MTCTECVGDDLEPHARSEERRSAGVAQLVDAPGSEAGPLADPLHRAAEGLWSSGGAQPPQLKPRSGEGRVGFPCLAWTKRKIRKVAHGPSKPG